MSRLWWFEGNRLQAERLGEEAIEVLKDQPASKAKAMAYSNMSQLKMLSDQTPDCLYWGQKALDAAEQAGDEETIAHALNCISTTLMLNDGTTQQGIDMLYQSLEISLKNAYHEHVARAYTNLGSNSVTLRNYAMARKTLEEGIHYCEERDLDSWKAYMTAWKSRLNLETGNWAEAYSLASHLIKNENQSPVVKIGALAVAATLKIRRGETGALPLLTEASARAFETMELQRIVPVMMAMLEYEWVTGEQAVSEASLAQTIDLLTRLGKFSRKSRFYFWLKRTSRTHMLPPELGETDPTSPEKTAGQEARFWEQIGSPYEQALCLSEGSEAEKRKALALVQQLGAAAVYERIKRDMRSSGIRKIPRGLRESTRNNPARLTTRELEVLQLLKKGIQNRQIAGQLYISPKTVDHHISSIFFKLDVNTRARAVGEALRMGIIN